MPAVTPPSHTLISCLSLSVHGSSLSRSSMATSPCPIMTHSMTTPCPDPSHRLGLAHPLPGPQLLLDLTSHRHPRLRGSETGLIALQTCSSCRAPFSAKAPPSTRLCTPETYERPWFHPPPPPLPSFSLPKSPIGPPLTATTLAPAPSPPTLQLHFSPVIPVLWPPTSSFYMPCSFLRRAFAHASSLCVASLPGFLFCPFGALVPIVILG